MNYTILSVIQTAYYRASRTAWTLSQHCPSLAVRLKHSSSNSVSVPSMGITLLMSQDCYENEAASLWEKLRRKFQCWWKFRLLAFCKWFSKTQIHSCSITVYVANCIICIWDFIYIWKKHLVINKAFSHTLSHLILTTNSKK